MFIREIKKVRYTYTPIFIAELFTIARTWKQLRCPSADKWIMEVVVHIHNGILLGHKKKQDGTICRDEDGLRNCHSE